MKSIHDDSSEQKTLEKIKSDKKRSRFTLNGKRNSVLPDNILSPIKVCPTTKKSSPVQIKIPTTQHLVRHSDLRQFDPLLEIFEEKEENQKTIRPSSAIIGTSLHEKKVPIEEQRKQLVKDVQIGEGDNTNAANELKTIDKKTIQLNSSADEWGRLSTIDEMSVEDLTEASSVLTIPGATIVKASEPPSSRSSKFLDMYPPDLIGKILPDLYGRLSEVIVEENSSCSSCSSYTTSCSTLEEFFYAPVTPAPYDVHPVRAQHSLHQELSLENDLCIEQLKFVHERNKAMSPIKEAYKKHLDAKVVELANAQLSHEQMHLLLTMGEDAFSNLHSKYNKAKEVIINFHQNEGEIKKVIAENESIYKNCKEKYDLLNEYGKIKLNEFIKAASDVPKNLEKEMKMMQTTVKHLHIKVSSLQQQVAQKAIECQELSNLFNEITVE